MDKNWIGWDLVLLTAGIVLTIFQIYNGNTMLAAINGAIVGWCLRAVLYSNKCS